MDFVTMALVFAIANFMVNFVNFKNALIIAAPMACAIITLDNAIVLLDILVKIAHY